MAAINDRLGNCEVCNNQEAKYTCPKCEVKTCCLPCVNIHKKELQCDGIRNKVAYKPLSKFTNLDLLSDYRLLEEVTRSIDACARDPSKHYTRMNKDLPVQLYRLRAAATKRGTRLQFLPQNFTRHKENSTYLNWKTQIISWRIEWVFAQTSIKVIDERISEGEHLSAMLAKYLNPKQCDGNLREHLQFYQSASYSGVSLLLKAENIQKSSSRFHQLDPSLTLKNALNGKTIIEFPTIFVVLNNHKDIYELVNSDDEEEGMEDEIADYEHNSNNYRSRNYNRKKIVQGGKRKKVKSLLFNGSDYSEESDSNNESDIKKHKRNESLFKNEFSGTSANTNVSSNIHFEHNKLPGFNILPYDALIKQQDHMDM